MSTDFSSITTLLVDLLPVIVFIMVFKWIFTLFKDFNL